MRALRADRTAFVPSIAGALALAIATMRLLALPVASLAQEMSGPPSLDPARHLARRSIECVERGDEAQTAAAKLAAYREGEDLARQAIALDYRSAEAHFALFASSGRLLLTSSAVVNPFSVGRTTRELDRALELDPNYADALAARGALYRQVPGLLGGDTEKAERYLTRAIELDPNAVVARIELAKIYRDEGDAQGSVALLETAADIAAREGKCRSFAEARVLLHELAKATPGRAPRDTGICR